MRNSMETNQKMAMAPATDGIGQLLKTPEGKLAMIELLVIFTAFLLLFLVAFGSCRRRCSGGVFRLVIFTAYTLSTQVFTYALGLMQQAPFRNEFFPVWAVFLMIILGSAHSISAYSLEDNEQWKSYNWQLMIKLIWLIFLIDWYIRDTSSTGFLTPFLLLILAVKADERARALMAASRHSLERHTKAVADYMSVEHESGEVDPVRMRGYTYLVRGEEERPVNGFVRAKQFFKRCLGKGEAALARHHRTPIGQRR